MIMLVLALALASVLIWGLFRFLRNRKGRAPVMAPAVVVPEDEEALAELLKLERSDWILRKKYKAYYFRVSEILKAYLGRRYRFDALESTSAEVLNAVRTQGGVSDEFYLRLENLFETLDRVKFTDHVPDHEEPKTILQGARSWVESTRKRLTAVQDPGSEVGVAHAAQ